MTVIDGLKLSFDGRFCSTIDAINESWRPGLRDIAPAVTNAPADVISADSPDYNSTISFSSGDQALQLRPWSPAPKVTITKVEAISPSVELPKDILKGAELHMISGRFEHNRGASEHIINPIIHFKSGADSIASISILARSDDTSIADTGTLTAGVAVKPKIDIAAATGNKLALWLSGVFPYSTDLHGDMRGFLESPLSRFKFKWENSKFKAAKESKLPDSVGAKAILGAQEKRGVSKTNIELKLDYWDGWDLSGKIEEGKLTTP